MSRNADILLGLQTAERENRLHHAYILSGPAKEAKVDCVERLAAGLFAEGSGSGLFAESTGGKQLGAGGADSDAVLARIRAGNHPDFTRLNAVEGKLSVDEVRELPRLLAFPPLESKLRFVLVADAAAMNQQAANSILKILEEPPAHTKFFLLCRDPAELLRTIVSRCQSLRFAPLPDSEMIRLLGDRMPEAKDALLGWSEGAMERAELLLSEEGAMETRLEACERLLELWESSPRIPSRAALWVEKVEEEALCQVVLDSWETLLRDLAFVSTGAAAENLRFREFHPRLQALARIGGEAALREIPERASAINRFRVYRRLNGNLRLDFAALLTELQIFSVGKERSPA